MKKRRERRPPGPDNPFRDVYGLADLYPIASGREMPPSPGPILRYNMYFGKARSAIATLDLEKRRTAEGNIAVDAVFDKTMRAEDEPAPLVLHSISRATFQFAGSPTAAKSWSLHRGVYAERRLMPETTVEKRFFQEDGLLRVETAGTTRRIRLRTPAIPDWALFVMFAALPRTAEPFRFTLVEDGDNVKEDQKIVHARTLEREWNGKPLKLREYRHTGVGVMPRIYWTDDDGTLLFSWAALTSYVLQ